MICFFRRYDSIFYFGDFFIWDFYSSFNKIMILLFSFFIFLFAEDSFILNQKTFFFTSRNIFFLYYREWYDSNLYNIIVKFKFIFYFICVFILNLILFSRDLFIICFFFEIVTFCFIFLFLNNGIKSKEALLKFFVYSALMSFYFFLV